MVHACIVHGCRSEWYPGCAVKFHAFPKEITRRNMWLSIMPLKSQFYKKAKICSLHFKTSDYDHTGRRLHQNAIPFFEDKSLVMEQDELINTSALTMFSPGCSTDTSVQQKLLEDPSENLTLSMPSTSSGFCDSQQLDYKRLCGPSDSFQITKRPRILQNIENQRSTSQVDKENIETMKPSYIDKSIQVKRRSVRENLLVKRNKVICQTVKRKTQYMNNIKSLVALIKKYTSQSEIENIINGNFADICKKLKKNNTSPQGMRYSEEVKAFALTLHFYSPKAYEFLKKHVALPHASTLRRSLSSFNCNVGFLTEVLEYLKQEVYDPQKAYLKNVALIFDGMALKQDLAYDKKLDKVFGYVDLGKISNDEPEKLASEALVFQIVSYSHYFKCPIGYFYILNCLPGELLAQLLNTAIIMLDEIGITVRSLTCDGAPSNINAYEKLGCSLRQEDFRPHFPHPNGKTSIVCFLDAAHMLKLARNALADCAITSKSGVVSFEYIIKLHEVQEKEGLKFSNKLSGLHVDFKNKKMNVKLAAQVLSSSVADALDFLRASGNPDFKESAATIEFLRIVDRLFDIMNSRSPFGTSYKSPLSPKNKSFWVRVFQESKEYLLSLTINGKNILNHARKTFALGFLINIASFSLLVSDLCELDNALKYLLTFKCSQDNLEIFFSCVRARGRTQDNPSPLEFRYIIRKMLFRNSIQPSVNANCVDHMFESSYVFEFNKNKKSLMDTSEPEPDCHYIEGILEKIDGVEFSPYQDNILYYISGFIVKQILTRISCQFCRDLLICVGGSESDHTYLVDINRYQSFTSFVNRGKLYFPSASVFKIVKYTDKVFKIAESMDHLMIPNIKNKLILTVLQYFTPTLRQMFHHPNTESATCSVHSHETKIIKDIANSFFNLRMRSKLKSITDKSLSHLRGKRQKLHKTVLFSHV